jgi:hypothetical protein
MKRKVLSQIDEREFNEIQIVTNTYKAGLKRIKDKYKFLRASNIGKASILNKLISEGKPSLNMLKAYWSNFLTKEEKLALLPLLCKGYNVQVWVYTYNGFNISKLKLNKEEFGVDIHIAPGCQYHLIDNLIRKPTDDEVLKMVQTILPRVQTIQTSSNILS